MTSKKLIIRLSLITIVAITAFVLSEFYMIEPKNSIESTYKIDFSNKTTDKILKNSGIAEWHNWQGTGCTIIQIPNSGGQGKTYSGYGTCSQDILNSFYKIYAPELLWNESTLPSPIYCTPETCGTPKGYTPPNDSYQQLLDQVGILIREQNQTNVLLAWNICDNHFHFNTNYDNLSFSDFYSCVKKVLENTKR